MSEPYERSAVGVFSGRALVTLGALMLGLSGLCTLAFAGVTLFSDLQRANSYADFSGMLPFMLVIGGLPMLIGFGIIRWGMWLLRRTRRAPDPAGPDDA
jgi:hypothetical protein